MNLKAMQLLRAEKPAKHKREAKTAADVEDSLARHVNAGKFEEVRHMDRKLSAGQRVSQIATV